MKRGGLAAAFVVLSGVAIWGISLLVPTTPQSKDANKDAKDGAKGEPVSTGLKALAGGKGEDPFATLRTGPTDGTKPSPVDVTNTPSATPAAPDGVRRIPAANPPAVTTPSGTTPTGTPPPASPSQQPQAPSGPQPSTLTPTMDVPPGLRAVPTAPPQPTTGAPVTSPARDLFEAGDTALSANKLLEARTLFNRALMHPQATESERAQLRSKLQTINEDLVFSTRVTPGDPMVESYTVQSGDALQRIARRQQLVADWRLISRINKIEPNKLKVGQKLKLVRGPFHAIVDKSDYRLDLYAGSPDEPDTWTFIRSFKVGLGADNTTPVGDYRVRNKLANPDWRNPRTGEYYTKDDPKNPIGEYWIGLEGVGQSAANTGYGIHGTIEPDSIGQQKSMGCVRLNDQDVAMMFEMLVEQISVVKIVN